METLLELLAIGVCNEATQHSYDATLVVFTYFEHSHDTIFP